MDKSYTENQLIINIIKVHIIYKAEMMWTLYIVL